MKSDTKRMDGKHDPKAGEEDFLSRWSRRKHETQQPKEEVVLTNEYPSEQKTVQLTDADMPPLESLDEHSDYTGFLSPQVSEALRKKALRILFKSPGFNIRDGLDDYDEDYTQFAKLGNIITADMQHRLEKRTTSMADNTAEEIITETTESKPVETEENKIIVATDNSAELAIDNDMENEQL